MSVIPHEDTVFNLQDKKRSAYSVADLAKVDKALDDWWDKGRAMESEAVNDLEKHLWLANGAAATVAIGFIQAKSTVPLWQFAGACAFVSGILLLVVLKYVSSLHSSHDRYRIQDARSRFDADEVTDDVFRTVRDRTFHALKRTYLVLQWGAGVAFIAGLVLTLIGVWRAV